jgi:hypothetical protein
MDNRKDHMALTLAEARIKAQKQNDALLMRALSRLEQQGECWIWQGAIRHKNPTMTSFTGGKQKYLTPRRLVHEFLTGPLHGMALRSKCENRLCCAPDHAEPSPFPCGGGQVKADARRKKQSGRRYDMLAFHADEIPAKLAAGSLVLVLTPRQGR